MSKALSPLHNPALGAFRVILSASCPEEILQEAYNLKNAMEKAPGGCPFEVAGEFSGSPNRELFEQMKADAVLLPESITEAGDWLFEECLCISVSSSASKLLSREGRHPLITAPESCLLGGRTILELALGNFSRDTEGNIYHKEKEIPDGWHLENWKQYKPRHECRTEKLLYPDSIAVIGASSKPGIGRSIMENIVNDGFTGKKYAINVRGEDVLNVKGYKSIMEIEDPVDLAVIATPAKTVPEIVESCGKKGVHALIIISAGFSETGEEGEAAQNELKEIANRYNMRISGPNCMGHMNVKVNMNTTIVKAHIKKGNVAFAAQSGAVGAAVLDFAEELGIGFSSIVSLGNQVDINICDLLPFYEEDENTRVIVLYLESILEPHRFWNLASKMTKPVILIKAGRTSVGMAAASSHTGSLAGNDKVAEAIIKKAGIIRLDSLEQCFNCAAALSKMPYLKSNRVAVITNAGGPGILISDVLSSGGFELPEPGEKLRGYLKENLMKEASTRNPIDVVAPAPPEHYNLSLKAILESKEYDAILLCCIPPATIDINVVAENIAPLLKEAEIPVLTNFFGPSFCKTAKDIMRQNNIPTFHYPEQMASTLSKMMAPKKYAAGELVRPGRKIINRAGEILALVQKGQYLPIREAYSLLSLFGIEVPKTALLHSEEDALSLKLSFPIAAKIDHSGIVHKSDVGGVRLNINSNEEMALVTKDFLNRFPGANGVHVQEMVPEGLELIVGSVKDPQLGPAVMVGLGGVWVEVMKDIAFGYPPLCKEEAMTMINSLRCEPLLSGHRGKAGVNKDALCEMIQRVSVMLLSLPGIAELDLNPVIYDPAKDKFIAADARIRKE